MFFTKIGPFLKRLLSGPESKVKGLHRQFKRTNGYWCLNRFYTAGDGHLDIKVRCGFDDPSLLDDCPFLAKIGPNEDKEIPHQFICFAYATSKERAELALWANKFPWAELLLDLDSEGVSAPSGRVVQITN